MALKNKKLRLNEPQSAGRVMKALAALSRPDRIADYQRFFKTGEGQYGEGDVFLGIAVPVQRTVARQYAALPLTEAAKLLASKVHEHRFTALEILVMQFDTANGSARKKIATFYLRHKKYVNNWDLVDTSAPYILGPALDDEDRSVLYSLARSKSIWDRRIAIIATQYFIRNNQFKDTLQLSEILLHDTHDLIQKAVGWMLREVGNKNRAVEEAFLETYAHEMPRTMLRYAIEKFDPVQRRAYMQQ